MLLPHHQNAGQNRDIKLANRSFENVTQLKYLRTAAININSSKEEIKRIQNSDDACYHSVQNLSSFRRLSENIEMRICESTVLPVDLHRCAILESDIKGET
jgi:hypothetical protein